MTDAGRPPIALEGNRPAPSRFEAVMAAPDSVELVYSRVRGQGQEFLKEPLRWRRRVEVRTFGRLLEKLGRHSEDRLVVAEYNKRTDHDTRIRWNFQVSRERSEADRDPGSFIFRMAIKPEDPSSAPGVPPLADANRFWSMELSREDLLDFAQRVIVRAAILIRDGSGRRA